MAFQFEIRRTALDALHMMRRFEYEVHWNDPKDGRSYEEAYSFLWQARERQIELLRNKIEGELFRVERRATPIDANGRPRRRQ